MHILFVHQHYPGQFGHIARKLVKDHGVRCTFASKKPKPENDGVQHVRITMKDKKAKEGESDNRKVPFLIGPFEDCITSAQAFYQSLKGRADIKPDLIVGHSGFGSTAFLADLYDCPIVNYFEFFYHAKNSDLDFRPEVPIQPRHILRTRTRNAMILLDLAACKAGYSPTEYQRTRLPREFQSKVETIHDGIDREFWYRRQTPRKIGDREIPPDTKIVTYVSRGFEQMRGFDIFMKVAKRICDARQDVIFVVVGSDRVVYGADLQLIKEKTFREHVLAQDNYDMNRFIFTGKVPQAELVNILSLSDLHIYLTAPFCLSWSLINAMACGCTILGSDTAPVQEVIQHERNGLLAGFFDVEGLTQEALGVLADPEAFRGLGQASTELVDQKFSLSVTFPKLLNLFQKTANGLPFAEKSAPQLESEPTREIAPVG